MLKSDVLAKDVIDACRLMGLNVPEAVQVLGLDNDDLICETETPSISSIGLDYEGIGVGVRTLEMRFKEATGGTVAERIRRIRLQRVCYWLKHKRKRAKPQP